MFWWVSEVRVGLYIAQRRAVVHHRLCSPSCFMVDVTNLQFAAAASAACYVMAFTASSRFIQAPA